VIITFGLALAGIVLFVLRKRAKRISKFVQQLPVAIEIIVRSLNAGHPLTSAISLVGREMADPIGSEFGILSDQLTFGSELDMAMLNMVDRVGADELNLVAVTVSVQRGTGGNLAEILENLAKMIRDRGLLRAKIRAISAEGRITAMIMSVFPLGLYLMISTLVPTYFDPVWESGYGTTVVLTIIGVMSVGIFIMFRMVRFDF
jgi:tight adherence protein B